MRCNRSILKKYDILNYENNNYYCNYYNYFILLSLYYYIILFLYYNNYYYIILQLLLLLLLIIITSYDILKRYKLKKSDINFSYQIMWAKSIYLGCGVNFCSNFNGGNGGTIVVCNYNT